MNNEYKTQKKNFFIKKKYNLFYNNAFFNYKIFFVLDIELTQ